MQSPLERSLKYLVSWTIPNLLSIQAPRGQYLKSVVYKVGYDTALESNWTFYFYPRGRINSAEDLIVIVPQFKARENTSEFKFTLHITDYNEENIFQERYVGTPGTRIEYYLQKSDLQAHHDLYLPNGHLKFGCFVEGHVRPYYENAAREYLNIIHLSALRLGGNGCDITLVAEDGYEIKVHKTLLLAQSPVFNAMFFYDTLENQTNRIEITDINISTLAFMVKYLYRIKCNFFNINHAIDVFIAADKYAIDKLKSLCTGYLRMNLYFDTAIYFLKFSDFFNEYELKAATILFIYDNNDEMQEMDEYKDLQIRYPQLLNKVYEINTWIGYND